MYKYIFSVSRDVELFCCCGFYVSEKLKYIKLN